MVHCKALQHTATHMLGLDIQLHIATRGNILQYTLQHTATRCNILQYTYRALTTSGTLEQNTATHKFRFHTHWHTVRHCNTMQHTATQCNTMQHNATHCNTMQHTCRDFTPSGTGVAPARRTPPATAERSCNWVGT